MRWKRATATLARVAASLSFAYAANSFLVNWAAKSSAFTEGHQQQLSYSIISLPLCSPSLSLCVCLFLFISPVRVGCRLHSVAGSWQPFALFLPISFGVIPLLLLWSAFPSCLPQSPVVPLASPLVLACCLLYDCSAIGLMISVCIAHFMHNFRKFHCGFAADVELLLLLLLLLLFVESLFQNPLLSTVLPFTLSLRLSLSLNNSQSELFKCFCFGYVFGVFLRFPLLFFHKFHLISRIYKYSWNYRRLAIPKKYAK